MRLYIKQKLPRRAAEQEEKAVLGPEQLKEERNLNKMAAFRTNIVPRLNISAMKVYYINSIFIIIY